MSDKLPRGRAETSAGSPDRNQQLARLFGAQGERVGKSCGVFKANLLMASKKNTPQRCFDLNLCHKCHIPACALYAPNITLTLIILKLFWHCSNIFVPLPAGFNATPPQHFKSELYVRINLVGIIAH